MAQRRLVQACHGGTWGLRQMYRSYCKWSVGAPGSGSRGVSVVAAAVTTGAAHHAGQWRGAAIVCGSSSATVRCMGQRRMFSGDVADADGTVDIQRRSEALFEEVLSPLNQRTLGPLDMSSTANIPMPLVFVLGNHSSGKSSFVNHVLDRQVQTAGVAPTDDGFTVIAPGHEDADQDGPGEWSAAVHVVWVHVLTAATTTQHKTKQHWLETPTWALQACGPLAPTSSTTCP